MSQENTQENPEQLTLEVTEEQLDNENTEESNEESSYELPEGITSVEDLIQKYNESKSSNDDSDSNSDSEDNDEDEESTDESEEESEEESDEDSEEETDDYKQKYDKLVREQTERTALDITGGKEGYNQMVSWASENLSQQEQDVYDSVMENGTPEQITFAVKALNALHKAAINSNDEPQVNTPQSNSPQADVFRSLDEMADAMDDPRYGIDPAYTKDVEEKSDRSPL